MGKQSSLALALCLTAVVGFAVVAYGSQLGFFKGSSAAGQTDTGADLIAIATYAAGFATTPTPVPVPAPIIVDEYIYEDVVIQPPASGVAVRADGAGALSPDAADVRSRDDGSDSTPYSDDDERHERYDDDDDDGHERYDDDDDERESEHGDEERHLEKEDLKGRVAAVNGSMITITGSRLGDAVITVTSQTEYRSDGDVSFSFGQIEVGMRLDSKVFVGAGNSPTGPGGSWVADRVTRKA